MSTKDDILIAARAAFDRGGLEGLSLREVARDVGITPMAIYRHFANKEALVDAIVLDGLAAWSERATKIPRGKPLAWLENIGECYLDFALKEPRRFEAAFLLHSRVARRYPDDFIAGRSPAGVIQLQVIEEALARGTLAGASAIEILVIIAGLSQGLVTLYRAGRIAGGEAGFRTLYRRAMKRCVESFFRENAK
ncbi:MAG TPA: TetR/AcrR family transcriptional regulator [Rhizomicrobium sp.]